MRAGQSSLVKGVVAVLISLTACTTTRSYRPVVNNRPPLVSGDAYDVRFLNGKQEAAVIAMVSDDGFTDRAGHSHLFSEIDEVREKRFSFLKTTGVVAGTLVVFAAAGLYLIANAIDDMLADSATNMMSEPPANSERKN